MEKRVPNAVSNMDILRADVRGEIASNDIFCPDIMDIVECPECVLNFYCGAEDGDYDRHKFIEFLTSKGYITKGQGLELLFESDMR